MRIASGLFQSAMVMLTLLTAGIAANGEIGVRFYTASRTERAMIQKVITGSPADQAGLKEDAVITHVDIRKVSNADDFREMLSGYQPGMSVKLELPDDEVVVVADVALAAGGSMYRNPLKAPESLEAVRRMPVFVRDHCSQKRQQFSLQSRRGQRFVELNPRQISPLWNRTFQTTSDTLPISVDRTEIQDHRRVPYRHVLKHGNCRIADGHTRPDGLSNPNGS